MQLHGLVYLVPTWVYIWYVCIQIIILKLGLAWPVDLKFDWSETETKPSLWKNKNN
jgi:hypothetical protein